MPLSPKAKENELLKAATRRQFFSRCGLGVGSMALASLAKQDALRASISEDATDNPIAAKQPHFLPKAKNII